MTAAIANTIEGRLHGGSRKVTWGTYTVSGGGTGGNINTGLQKVDFIFLQPLASSVIATGASINETIPTATAGLGTAITTVTSADEVGYFLAVGRR